MVKHGCVLETGPEEMLRLCTSGLGFTPEAAHQTVSWQGSPHIQLKGSCILVGRALPYHANVSGLSPRPDILKLATTAGASEPVRIRQDKSNHSVQWRMSFNYRVQ